MYIETLLRIGPLHSTMEGKPTYDDEPEPRPAYTVDSYSAVATASMPSKPFHEREEDGRTEQRP